MLGTLTIYSVYRRALNVDTTKDKHEKQDHAQTTSFPMIHWRMSYDLNYSAGIQSLGICFLRLLKFSVFDIVWKWDILMGNENHVSSQLWWEEIEGWGWVEGWGFLGAGLSGLVPLMDGDTKQSCSLWKYMEDMQ